MSNSINELVQFGKDNALAYASDSIQSDPLKLRQFLYKASQQLMSSYDGAFGTQVREAYQRLNCEDQAWFLFQLAELMRANKLEDRASALLQEHEAEAGYLRWHNTLAKLTEIDPEWKEHATVHALPDGIQVCYGKQDKQFNVSMVLHSWSYGRKEGSYEIWPVFDGKDLREWDSDQSDEVMGWLPLENAVRIAHATLERDEAKYRREIETAYEKAA